MSHCANEHAKEKEKNTTTLAIYHGLLLVTMGNNLRNDIRTFIKQITIMHMVGLYSAVILKPTLGMLYFAGIQLELVIRVNNSW